MSSPDSTPSSAPLSVEGQAQWLTEQINSHDLALRGYLRRRFPSVEVDDIVQESYFRLLKARAKGKLALSKAYLFAIARNTALTLLHRRRIYSPGPLTELPDSAVIQEESDASHHVDDQLRFELALEAIDQLPPRCREIFRLAALEHLPAAEIAQRTGVAENTVYAQLAIGVRKCAEFLRARGERR